MGRKTLRQVICVSSVLLLTFSVFQIFPPVDDPIGFGSAASSWTQKSASDFKSGFDENVSISSNGDMTIALKREEVKDSFHNYGRKNFNVANSYGGTNREIGRSVQPTTDGGYIMVGYTNTFGAGSWDIWLVKTDSKGNMLWNKTFGGKNEDYGYSIVEASDGGYVLVGYTDSYGAGGYDVWVIKTDSSGNKLWARTIGSGYEDKGHFIQKTSDGGYVITGTTYSNLYLQNNLLLIKLNSTGSEKWSKNFTGGWKKSAIGQCVRETSNKGFIIVGTTWDSSTGDNVLLIRTDANGNHKWTTSFGGSYQDRGHSVQETKDGGFIIAGEYLDSGTPMTQAWLIKTSSSGSKVWDKKFGGSSHEMGYAVHQTSEGGYLLAGSTRSVVNGIGILYIVKTDKNGNKDWDWNSGSGWSSCYDISKAPDGDYLITGYHTVTGYGHNFFLRKLNETGKNNIVSGFFESKNILSGIDSKSIDYFNYTASIPSAYTLNIQFTRDKKFWYDSNGTKDKWTTLKTGAQSISLAKLGWTGSSFYYKIDFDPDNPTLNIGIDFNLAVTHFPSTVNYKSIPYDSGGTSLWNKLYWNATTPTGTSIKLQLRTAETKTDLYQKNFVGPDGKTNSYYDTSSSTIWAGHTYDRWIQYKLYLSRGNQTNLPVVNEITITYHFVKGLPVLESPVGGSYIKSNTPIFTWKFSGTNITQKGFQLLVDDNNDFNSPEFDSGVKDSTKQSWQFKNGTEPVKINDNTWYWRVRSKNESGNWSRFSKLSSFTIDTTAPSSKVITPTNNSGHYSITTISGSAGDGTKGSGIKKVEVLVERRDNSQTWNGNGWDSNRNWLTATGKESWSLDISKISSSSVLKFKILTRATDNLNHTENPTDPFYFFIDKEGPSITINKPDKTRYVKRLSDISGTATDGNGSGIKSVHVCIMADFGYDPVWDGSKWVETLDYIWLKASGTTNWSYGLGNLIWNQGYYYISARARDLAGNTKIVNTNFIYDYVSPTVKIYGREWESLGLKNMATIGGSVWDNIGEGSVSSFDVNVSVGTNYYNPGASWSPYWEDWTCDLGKIKWPTEELETSATIIVRGKDRAGNTGTASSTFLFDTKKPKSYIGYPLNNSKFYDLNEIKGTAIDKGSGIKNVAVSLKRSSDNMSWDGLNNKWITGEAWWWASGTASWTYDTTKISWNEGKYIVRSKAYDYTFAYNTYGSLRNAENIEIPGPGIEFFIGNRSLSLSISINNGDVYTRSSSVTVALSPVAENTTADKMSYSFDNSAWTEWENYTSKKTITLTGSDGTKTVYFRIKDTNGTTTSASDSIILDTKLPTVLTVTSNPSGWTNNTQPKITFSALDTTSGIDHYEVRIDGGTFSRQISPYTLPTLTDGVHNVTVRAVDKAGNFVDEYVEVSIDTKSPMNLMIVINDNATKTNSSSVNLRLYASDSTSGLDQMSFSDDGSKWSAWENFTTTRTYELPSGDGNKTVYFRVKDYANNIALSVYSSIILNTSSNEPPGNGNDTGGGSGSGTLPDPNGKTPKGKNNGKGNGNNNSSKDDRIRKKGEIVLPPPPSEKIVETIPSKNNVIPVVEERFDQDVKVVELTGYGDTFYLTESPVIEPSSFLI